MNTAAAIRAGDKVGLPPSLAVALVQEYLRQLTVRELVKNLRVVKLAKMKVGELFYSFGGGYLQTQDRRRARLLLNDPQAAWKSRWLGGVRVIERVR